MPSPQHPASASAEATDRPTLAQAFRVWLVIGLMSFGGPAGQIALMHRVLVEERRWLGEARFLHALNYCMLLPGPEAQQLATYVGWLLHRTLGGLIAGILFVLPGALVMLALSIGYALYAELPLVAAAFAGVKAAVLIVVIEAVLRIGRRALKTPPMYLLAATAFVAIFLFDVPFPAIVAGAALVGFAGGRLRPDLFLVIAQSEADSRDGASVVDAMAARGELDHTRPRLGRSLILLALFALLWGGPVLGLLSVLGPDHVWSQTAGFFSKLAVVTFGGAYAVLAYMAQQAVESYHWLSGPEMLDGLGLAETTPGPLIMVTQFVGFLASFRNPGTLDPLTAGILGAALTTWVTFAPCFLWIFLGAPSIERLRGNRLLGAALSAITAAVVGVILNLAAWFGLRVVFSEVGSARMAGLDLPAPVWSSLDPQALALTVVAAVALLALQQGILRTLALCAGLSLAAHLWL